MAGAVDPWEIRWDAGGPATKNSQRSFRSGAPWSTSPASEAGWVIQAHADRSLPARLWGPGQSMPGQNVQEKAIEAWGWALGPFGWDPTCLGELRQARSSKHHRVFCEQLLDGQPVLGSKLVAKFTNDELVSVSCDWWPDLVPQEWGAGLDMADVLEFLEADMAAVGGNSGTDYITDFAYDDLGMAWLPVYSEDVDGFWEAHPTWQIEITGRRGVIPVRYLTWIDMTDGSVVMRTNRVMHHGPESKVRRMGQRVPDQGEPNLERAYLPSVHGQVDAMVHPSYPNDDPQSMGMPHLEVVVGSDTSYTDAMGTFTTSAEGSYPGTPIRLQGHYATVFTELETPSDSVDLVEGFNLLSAPGNVKEASAYLNTNRIHDHMKQWMPEFLDLDWSLPVNIDVVGECNAFYDGESINFYDQGGGCAPSSLVADVVFHEYGHAINDWFYQSFFMGFNNGAMNEGYADFWAMSLADVAIIGQGLYEDDSDGLRRYDQNPKVYPDDLVGQVHADGEIICGAWYDTHLLMGGDWDQTLTLFIDAYPGLQATLSNGQEGQAYSDVLLDVLQADDDDGNVLNGTPNALAILEGFAMHGITLFSYAEIEHNPVEFSPADSDILIEAQLDAPFPYSVYFDAIQLHFRTSSDDDYDVVELTQDDSGFSCLLPGMPAGTVVEYYLDVVDSFDGESSTVPRAADHTVNGNLPFSVLVGVEPVLTHDLDQFNEFGIWEMELPTDNAESGIWEEGVPVGSMIDVSDIGTVVAPIEDHTEGENGRAFVTGLNPPLGAGIGENDVDGGRTSLVSPILDLTPYENPVLAYWRWYTNAPPTGNNPGSDWWQVEVTNDGGNTWEYVENTSQEDVSWRRKAFRIADVVEPSESFRIRFVASDSTTANEYLDGASWIEAAVDDLVLYDALPSSTDELDDAVVLMASPNPSDQHVAASGWTPTGTVRIVDLHGRELYAGKADGMGQVQVNVAAWPNGMYVMSGWDSSLKRTQVKFEVQH